MDNKLWPTYNIVIPAKQLKMQRVDIIDNKNGITIA
jgi:hypothetical protein